LKGQARRAKRDHSDEIGVKRVNVSTTLSPVVVYFIRIGEILVEILVMKAHGGEENKPKAPSSEKGRYLAKINQLVGRIRDS